ncbi:glycosyltransferase [Candidatus Roizmanbacteria bacterium]|nr:glycosyltransferase [Candidatus Roizmanbacteria bacterium]
MKKAVIILPTINESGTIKELIESIFLYTKANQNWEIHVLVVDSESIDSTIATIKELQKNYQRVHLIQTRREGLGKAYIHGFNHALEKLHPYLIFEMDADLSHDPKKIPDFLKEIEQGADFVLGSRYTKYGSIPSNWGIHRKILSVLGNIVIRILFAKPRITDWTGGYRAIKSWIIKESIPHIRNYTGYVFQVALLDFALKKHAIIAETPIRFKDRTYGQSKINSLQTIIQTLLYVFTHSSFVKFIIVGSVGFIIDFTFAYFFIYSLGIAKPTANAMSAEITIVSNFLLNNFWSFAHKKIAGGIFTYIRKLLAFNIVASGSIFIQWIGMLLALKVFGDYVIRFPTVNFPFHSWILYKIFIIVLLVIPYSYIVYNKVIWRRQR